VHLFLTVTQRVATLIAHRVTDSTDRYIYLFCGEYFRWRNWIVRTIFTMMMIISFSIVIYLGPVALLAMVSVKNINYFFFGIDQKLNRKVLSELKISLIVDVRC